MTNKKQTGALKPSPKNVAISELLTKTDNPWTEIPKFKSLIKDRDAFLKSVQHCRFFYRTEPLVNTVIDKLVEIGISDLVISKNKLSDNEYRAFLGIKPKLVEFAEQMATEYLLSGLVVPEVSYNTVNKEELFNMGIKKYTSLELPDSMWVRDPTTIVISTSLLADKPSYFVEVNKDLLLFIQSKGTYPDGRKDEELYKLLLEYYPDFVKRILKGEKEILLEDSSMVFRRKYTSDNPYPIPYANSALEALHHKRKLRRMDYSIIDKVISAIMHIKLGDKDFPINDSDEDNEYISDIREQLRMRGRNEQVLERIFQLITNHTVDIKWIFPDTSALLNTQKYDDINQEILFGLGFPRVLITGEALKSGTSDSEIATLAPIKTAENFRRKIIEVIKDICAEISRRNGFKSAPNVEFKAINLHKFSEILEGLSKLYDVSAISRTTFGSEFGYDFVAEADLLGEEMKILEDKGLPEFGATPNSKTSVLMEGEETTGKTTGKPATDTQKGSTTGQKPDKQME